MRKVMFMKNTYIFATRFFLILGMMSGALMRSAAAAGDVDDHLSIPGIDLRLKRAVDKEDIEAIKALINEKVSVNGLNGMGRTALMMAAEKKASDVVNLLLKAGASIDTQEKEFGFTALIMAVGAYYNYKTVALLIEYGANLDLQRTNGDTALIEVMRMEQDPECPIFISVVKSLIKAGANPYIKNNKRKAVFSYLTKKPEALQLLTNTLAERDRVRAAKKQDVQYYLPSSLADLALDYDVAHPTKASQEDAPAEDEAEESAKGRE